MTTVRLGDRVEVQYLRLINGGEATQPEREGKVLEFVVGSKRVIPGISFGVVGMVEGEEKRLTLSPKDAYGAVHPTLIQEVARKRFPSHLQLQVGQRLAAKKPSSGRRRQVKVLEVRPDSVLVDGNHPLAGRTLEVQLHLVALHSRRNGVE
jgi:FKBP-type peptidyl-prolyl cis-trans isomerase 2